MAGKLSAFGLILEKKSLKEDHQKTLGARLDMEHTCVGGGFDNG